MNLLWPFQRHRIVTIHPTACQGAHWLLFCFSPFSQSFCPCLDLSLSHMTTLSSPSLTSKSDLRPGLHIQTHHIRQSPCFPGGRCPTKYYALPSPVRQPAWLADIQSQQSQQATHSSPTPPKTLTGSCWLHPLASLLPMLSHPALPLSPRAPVSSFTLMNHLSPMTYIDPMTSSHPVQSRCPL